MLGYNSKEDMKMQMPRAERNQVKNAIRQKYAWPGGYPLYIITSDGAVLCVDCSKKQFRQIAWDWTRHLSTGWFAVAADINWENSELACNHCGNRIESAYGEKE